MWRSVLFSKVTDKSSVILSVRRDYFDQKHISDFRGYFIGALGC